MQTKEELRQNACIKVTLDEKDDKKDIKRRLSENIQQGVDKVDDKVGNILEGVGKWLKNF